MNEQISDIMRLSKRMADETEKIIIGKRDRIELIIMALLAEGHVLLDDLPGVGKTTLVRTLSIVSGCSSKRIQFVPDLLPSDIIGMNIYDRKENEFRLVKGPLFTNILLADEINRAVPRTQSALLEAMEEKCCTIDGETLALPEPFMVMATQNPVESEGTFRLPAAQMDRFLIRLTMGYPEADEEREMLFRLGDRMDYSKVSSVTTPEEIMHVRSLLTGVSVSRDTADYIVALCSASRKSGDVVMGAGPRASRALYKASKARAAMQGRDFVTPDDIKYLAPYVLTHRIMVSAQSRLAGKTPEKVLGNILESVPVPPDKYSIGK